MALFQWLNEPSLLFFGIIVFLVTISLNFTWRNKTTSSKTKRHLPPSPPKLPIIGNLHQLGKNPHISLLNLAQKYGPILFLQLGQVPTVRVSSARVAKEALKTHDLAFIKPSTNLLSKTSFLQLYGHRFLSLWSLLESHKENLHT